MARMSFLTAAAAAAAAAVPVVGSSTFEEMQGSDSALFDHN
jgi:hypothetical protein